VSTSPVRAVLFDWRGTLVTSLSEREWAEEALRRLGRRLRPNDVEALVAVLTGVEAALDPPGLDADAGLHRRTYTSVLREAGLDEDLVEALYAVESDISLNRFADDAGPTLCTLSAAGLGIAVVSDIHVDVRPAFAAAGLADLVAVFTLSFEQGRQKPDPALFLRTVKALGVPPGEALMVGDRARPDGGAVSVGIPTLLLPPLRGPGDRRLQLVVAACGLRAD
jgi:FMN phosphatase YigB (HAD superfamily)